MAATSPCPDRCTLKRLVLGQMPDAEAERLESHVSVCDDCLENVRTLEVEDALVEIVRGGAQGGGIPRREADLALITQLRRLGPAPVPDPTPFPATTPWATPDRVRELYPFLSAPQGADEIGQLGPYRVRKVLGSGGMGVVFLAEDPRLKRVVALKVLVDSRCADPRYLARFQREAEAVARLKHPDVVQVHEVGEHRGRPYLVLEYVAGGNLAERLAGTPQPIRASAERVERLARAMHHAHQQGIVHRDLKPANILLQAQGLPSPGLDLGDPKITDFGLAKRLDAEGLTQSGEVLGTPAYMAPEQARGRDSGPLADIYALGAILYECLTGRPPFQGETPLATLEQVTTYDPVPPRTLQPKVPADLQTICLKCLEKEPHKRYATAQDLADDLGRFLRGEPIQARPVAARERLWKWARRKPALAGLVVLSSLFLFLLLGGGLWYQARLRAAVDEAHKEQHRADANYRKARAAVQRMLARLGEKRLADVPRLQELRRDQLEDALAFYQGILGDLDNPDPDVRFDVAVAYQETATIQSILGRSEPARENFRQAIAMLEDLCAAHPDVLAYAAQLAACCTALGGLDVVQNRLEDARDPYEKALAIWERLALTRPGDPAWQNALATSHHNLGHVCQLCGPMPEAERHYARTVALRTELVRSHPQVEEYRARLGEDYLNLGLLHQKTGRPGEAGAAFPKAEALLGPLGREHPEQYALSLAGLYVNWANLHKERGQPQVGLGLLNQAIRLAEERLQQEPQVLEARKRALQAHGARAQVYEALKRYADAVPDWDRVVELGPGPDQAGYRAARALARVRVGEYASAVVEAKELFEKERVSKGTLSNVACIYALAVTGARSDTRLPASERARLAEQYASQAVALLQKLRASGYFKDAAHAELLVKDPDLQPLRDRADFTKLLEQVEKGPGR